MSCKEVVKRLRGLTLSIHSIWSRHVQLESCLQDLACLAKVVSQNQDLAGVRPSLMAASLLVADRQAHGELPSWPSCLARLTGYAPAHLQDLVNAHLPALRCGPAAAIVDEACELRLAALENPLSWHFCN